MTSVMSTAPAALLILAATTASVVGAAEPTYHHLRSLRDLPFPRTLAAATALHTEAMRRSRLIEAHHGHRRAGDLGHSVRVGSGMLRTHAAGTPITPAAFGADPTGERDSTAAMTAAVAALLEERGPRHTMASNITDLGGATLDLSGGTYLISAPIVIPAMYGNLQIVRGTLRASTSFPGDRWLVEIGDSACEPRLPSGKPDVQGSCGQFINLNQMLFDAGHVAAGGVHVSKTMGTTLGPSVFFTGFTTAGVKIDGGHECMIQQAWFAECEWSDARGSVCQEDPDAPGGNTSKSIGVQINGNDHFLTDVIVFEAVDVHDWGPLQFTHIGVEINGAANLLQGVHTWNAAVYGKSGGYAWKGGVGIAVNAYQNRILGCYLDFSALSVLDPSNLVVEATFFLATPAVFTSGKATSLTGVMMHGNTYAVGGDSIRIDPLFVDGSDCDISGDIGAAPKTTRASKTLTRLAPTTEFDFVFPELLLPSIEEIEFSFAALSVSEPWAQWRAIKGNASNPRSVVVQSSTAVRGTVTVRVAQAVHGRTTRWVNALSGLCLDNNGHNDSDGNPVDVWSCVDGAPNEVFIPDSEGHLVGQDSQKCLSTTGCSAKAGACIQPCVAGKDTWILGEPDPAGRLTIRPGTDPTACLQATTASPGSRVDVAPCASPIVDAQLWSTS